MKKKEYNKKEKGSTIKAEDGGAVDRGFLALLASANCCAYLLHTCAIKYITALGDATRRG